MSMDPRTLAARNALIIIICIGTVASAWAQDHWSRFRGPGGRGLAAVENPNLPKSWSTTRNVAWKTSIPGLGWSSPIVWGDTIFVTTVTSDGKVETPQGGLYRNGERAVPNDVHHWKILAIDFDTGTVRWEREVFSGVPDFAHHLKNTFASHTPVTDGERVYVYFGNVGIFTYDMDGNPQWSTEMPWTDSRNGWGAAASPVLHNGRLYLVNDNDEQSYVMALSAETGAKIWQTDRDEGSNWSSPFVWENSARTELVTTGTDKVRSYDLDGNLLWELSGMSTITIPTPFADGDLLYITSGYVGDQFRPVYAIRPGALGDISLTDEQTSNEFIAWHLTQGGPYNPSPILYGGYYYTLYDRGLFTAHDAKTGTEIYGRQRIAVGEAFTASPWAYNGMIFALSEEGTTYAIEAGAEFKVVGENPLDEFAMATPAIVGSSLVIRTARHLYRIVNQ